MRASPSLQLTLEELLREAAPRLTASVLAEMYSNPFWEARFGDRGRQHGGQDGNSHVTYLVEALAAGDPRVFLAYASWLREVLVARGMCSRHLVDNFERLANAIDGEPWEGRERAVAILRAGAHALVYTGDDAGAIDGARSALARDTVASLYAAHPDWLTRFGESGRARCVDDVDYHLSYLADALAFSRREQFVAYIAFMATFLERRAVPRGHLRECLVTLSNVLRSRLPALAEAPFDYLVAAHAFDVTGL
jgi:hypothetical protein